MASSGEEAKRPKRKHDSEASGAKKQKKNKKHKKHKKPKEVQEPEKPKKPKKHKKNKKHKEPNQTEQGITTTVSPLNLEAMLLAQQQPHFSGLDTDLSAFLKDYERFGARLNWSAAEFVDRLKLYVALQLQSPVLEHC